MGSMALEALAFLGLVALIGAPTILVYLVVRSVT